MDSSRSRPILADYVPSSRQFEHELRSGATYLSSESFKKQYAVSLNLEMNMYEMNVGVKRSFIVKNFVETAHCRPRQAEATARKQLCTSKDNKFST